MCVCVFSSGARSTCRGTEEMISFVKRWHIGSVDRVASSLWCRSGPLTRETCQVCLCRRERRRHRRAASGPARDVHLRGGEPAPRGAAGQQPGRAVCPGDVVHMLACTSIQRRLTAQALGSTNLHDLRTNRIFRSRGRPPAAGMFQSRHYWAWSPEIGGRAGRPPGDDCT